VVAQSFFRDNPLSKRSPDLHLRMGNVLATANRTSESLLHYEEAAETAKDSTVAHMAMANLGVSLQGLKRWREAEQVWQRMLQRFPDGQYAAEASLNVARCKMEQGDYRGAIAAYEQAMPLLDTESRARAFYWMGTSYEQLGDYQSAVVEYLKVPYLASGGGMWVVTAQLKAADCYIKIDRDDAAREIYGKVIRAHGATSNWGGMAQKKLDELNAAAQTSGDGGRR
jgi:TolA-binding protein